MRNWGRTLLVAIISVSLWHFIDYMVDILCVNLHKNYHTIQRCTMFAASPWHILWLSGGITKKVTSFTCSKSLFSGSVSFFISTTSLNIDWFVYKWWTGVAFNNLLVHHLYYIYMLYCQAHHDWGYSTQNYHNSYGFVVQPVLAGEAALKLSGLTPYSHDTPKW